MGATHLLTDVTVSIAKTTAAALPDIVFFGILLTKNQNLRGKHADEPLLNCRIPDDLEAGVYLLNLQVPPIQADAIPSWPMIYKTDLVEE